MQDIYKLFDKAGSSYIVREDSIFYKFIDEVVYNTDIVGQVYFLSIRNQISFSNDELKDMTAYLERIQNSKDLEEKLASGNPVFDKDGNLRFGMQAELYNRVITTALWRKGKFKPEVLQKYVLQKFKELVYNGAKIDPTFKEDFLKRQNNNIRKARNEGRIKGKKTEKIQNKYERVFDVLERYCKYSE